MAPLLQLLLSPHPLSQGASAIRRARVVLALALTMAVTALLGILLFAGPIRLVLLATLLLAGAGFGLVKIGRPTLGGLSAIASTFTIPYANIGLEAVRFSLPAELAAMVLAAMVGGLCLPVRVLLVSNGLHILALGGMIGWMTREGGPGLLPVTSALILATIMAAVTAGVLETCESRLEAHKVEAEAAVSDARAWAAALSSTHRQLVAAQEQITEADRRAALGELSESVAHELNNPLTTVILEAADLESDLRVERPDLADRARELREAAERCGVVIRTLLDFAKPPRHRFERVEIATLVSRALALVQHQLEIHEARVQVAVPPGLFTSGDPHQLMQVLVALLLNASEALEGGGDVSIEAGQSGSEVWVSITDNGRGIGEQDRPRIFQPFFTTRPHGRGTGLGLAVSQQVIRDHCGTIEVKTCPGEGSTFTVRLPETP